jgi:hypothetical protein
MVCSEQKQEQGDIQKTRDREGNNQLASNRGGRCQSGLRSAFIFPILLETYPYEKCEHRCESKDGWDMSPSAKNEYKIAETDG